MVRDPDDLTNIAVELTGGDPQVAVNSVAWKLSSEGAPAFDGPAVRSTSDQTQWEIDASHWTWSRGIWRFEATITTDEVPARHDSQVVSIRFQPPAPKVQLRDGKSPATETENPQLVLPLQVTTGGRQVHLKVTVAGNDRKERGRVETESADPTFPFVARLKLRQGYNQIEWEASNVGALGEFKELETSRGKLVVNYYYELPLVQPPALVTSTKPDTKTEPDTPAKRVPRIEPFRPIKIRLTRLTDGKAIHQAPIEQPVIVRTSKPVMVGSIDAGGRILTNAQFKVGTQSFKPLMGFVPGKGEVQFTQPLSLSTAVGPQSVVIKATTQSAKEKSREESFTFDYRPAVPRVKSWEIAPVSTGKSDDAASWSDSAVELNAGAQKPEVSIQAEFSPPDNGDLAPFWVKVLVDKKPVAQFPPAVPFQFHKIWKGRIPLKNFSERTNCSCNCRTTLASNRFRINRSASRICIVLVSCVTICRRKFPI